MLTTIQMRALTAMTELRIGAVCVGTIYGIEHGGHCDAYAFPEDIREGSETATGDDIALCVMAILNGDPRDADVISA